MSSLTTIDPHVPSTQNDAVLATIKRIALDPNVDITKLEKMLAMQERILARNAEMEFNADLAALQTELPMISEKGEIWHKGTLISTYAKFEDINETIKPILSKYGFAISFRMSTNADFVKVTCNLVHRNGHKETTEILLPTDLGGAKNKVQAVASSVSYGKRYTLEAMLNISTGGQDDDGEGTEQTELVDMEEVTTLSNALEEVQGDQEQFLAWLNNYTPNTLFTLQDIPKSMFSVALNQINRKRIRNDA